MKGKNNTSFLESVDLIFDRAANAVVIALMDWLSRLKPAMQFAKMKFGVGA